MEIFPSLLGFAMGAIVLSQFAMWTAVAIRRLHFDRRQFELGQKLLRRQLEQPCDSEALDDNLRWHGYRKFSIQKLQSEAKDCVTIDLVAEDGRPLPIHLPGQHITIRLSIPGQSRPIVRCYSLSDAPSTDRFRITVRAIAPPRDNPSAPPGVASGYLNHYLSIGDRVDVKAPSGAFYLDLNDRRPAVFLAGGIGITPIMSMLAALVQNKIKREVLLVYGVQNGEHHTFKRQLAKISAIYPLINVVTCYSNPLPSDTPRVDFHLAGRVSIEAIRRLVPSNQIPFYLCGPSAFMQTLVADLREWGVPEAMIHFEAFGPASVRKTKNVDQLPAGNAVQPEASVSFHKSAKQARWPCDAESILDLADKADVTIPSGCRAGNCGTCQTRLISGQVSYVHDIAHADCEPGHVLACVARPVGDIIVDA